MKVLVTTSSFGERENESVAALTAAGISLLFNPYGRRLNEDEARDLFREHDPIGAIAGVEPLTDQVMASAPRLRAIARCGTGMDSVDKEAATRRGIRLSNTPDAPAVAVAELTIALILAVLRRVAEADRALRAGTWKALTGGLLGARTLGLVGYGRIGRRVAALARPFGARIVAADPFVDRADVPILDLDQVLSTSDIVSLHSSGAALRLGNRELMLMKPAAILINTARGELVDETSLLEALRSGRLAGAGLDVFETEPYSGPLTELPGVVLTAHMGSYAAEARSLQEREALANLVADLRRSGVIA